MRQLTMQQTSTSLPTPRFVRLVLQEDLLGGWELIRETGQAGGRSQVRRALFLSRAQAVDAFEAARAEHARRGFEVRGPHPDAA
ncbi:MAG TPA: WGR domain-containing protein [Chiayiivirga sp.]|jgi:hypothetical protein|uniref:WGR domain-containing protein n=1 Tax=Denitratimonas tolerans TaxID=1338420 RepID=A0AAW9R3I4_9GAMM|nr:WGR domain-containing protein [Xanthomonadaceae bacterium]MDX9765005.1 WGR domain-containing protein [Chiayiivirga sp.]HRN59706.1 WGR domain-containing protein [Chiayiivirga sp.]HRO87920.1 WGR domain-containing protein [Chiayiivirga sp.]HRQ34515.1 WGR domain-containing protein [Chiayiivirga sp.]